MKRKGLVFLISVLWLQAVEAQTYAPDALLFSQTRLGGTARSMAMGGVNASFGADLTSVSGNPAGLGMYTKNEFSFSPLFGSASSKSSYLGADSENGRRDAFYLNNIGGVLTFPSLRYQGQKQNEGWLSWSLGLSYGRVANYSREINYSGASAANSIVDAYLNNASAYYLAMGSGDPGAAGFSHGLLNGTTGGPYTRATDQANSQQMHAVSSGYQTEFAISAGGNYSNWLFLGGGLGFTRLDYSYTADYVEQGTMLSTASSFPNQTYTHQMTVQQNTTGNGVNVKLGAIVRANDYVRVGLNFQSPTWWDLTDVTTVYYDSQFKGNSKITTGTTNISQIPDNNEYGYDPSYTLDYSIRSPMKLVGGITLLSPKLNGIYGLLSADVEYLDYTSIYLSSDVKGSNATIKADNSYITNNYQNVINFRLGAEIKADKISFRVGYANNGTPYKATGTYYQTEAFTGGVGYREKTYYVDFALQKFKYNIDHQPYFGAEYASVKNSIVNAMFTIGFFF